MQGNLETKRKRKEIYVIVTGNSHIQICIRFLTIGKGIGVNEFEAFRKKEKKSSK